MITPFITTAWFKKQTMTADLYVLFCIKEVSKKENIHVKVSFCKGKKLKQLNKTNDITDILKQKHQQNS